MVAISENIEVTSSFKSTPLILAPIDDPKNFLVTISPTTEWQNSDAINVEGVTLEMYSSQIFCIIGMLYFNASN